MDYRRRGKIISMAVILAGVTLSGLLFFIGWITRDTIRWSDWLTSLSYASFIGSVMIAFIIQIGNRYNLPRGRVVGFFMIIGWITAALFSTTFDTINLLSANIAAGLSYVVVMGGLVVLVLPGFLLMLFPWPPRFLKPKNSNHNAFDGSM